MKILQINVYNYRKGGSEAVYFRTCRLLEQAGHEVVRFALRWDENEPAPTDSYFPESKATRRGPLRQAANLVNYFYHFEAARKLEALIDAERPDIAHVHLIWGQLTPSILVALRRKGVPVVATAHDYRIVCPAYTFRDGQGRICEACRGVDFRQCISRRCAKGSLGASVVMAAEQWFRNCFYNPSRMLSGMIFVSDFSRSKHLEYMPALGQLPMLTLHNMAPSAPLEPKTAVPGDRYFIYFGRLSEEKGVRSLFEAIAMQPDIRFKIVGDGPLRLDLEAMMAGRGLTNVEMLGFRTGDELTSLIRNALFTIVPSECYENNPMSVVESYALGVPVIGARIGGIPEIVDEGTTGLYFRSGDSADLAQTIARASALPDDRLLSMGAAAASYAATHFSPDSYVGRLTDFYRSIIGPR